MSHVKRPADRSEPRPRKVRVARVTASAAALVLATAGGLTAWSLSSPNANASGEQNKPAAKKSDKGEDLNGDGYADLVSGAPGGTVSGKANAGYVTVTYGSANGLDTSHKKLVDRSTSGVPGSAAGKQQFGASFSKGDLDGDGYGDLVIGSQDASAGSVVLWGSDKGLTGGTAIPSYGITPQIGDFDGDKKADLALLGGPGLSGDEPVKQSAALWKGPLTRSGTPAKKLDYLEKSEWDSDTNSAKSISGPSTARGVGDVNGDGRQDLALWRYEGDGVYSSDALLGSASGFKVSKGPEDGAEDMETGDVDGDGYDDLVASEGSDLEDQVTIVFGSKSGLSGRKQTFNQSLDGFPGEPPESGENLGSCVSVADVTGDGRAEVALGISQKDSGEQHGAGAVALLHGSKSGVTGTGSQVLDQDSPGVPGVAEWKEEFGAACTLLDVNGDGHRDLNVSSTMENDSSGAVWSLRGTGTGLTTKNAASFGPSDLGTPAKKAQLGSSLR
ncbi:hypothetical protein HCC61_14270 [Streptomyces sp. HNM0575]|uniref:FG-GAP repeat protein n=1 Tax=Streptomyces sp. HNM0575 TaxID=2716338 RepID=UPI00145F690A|nr:FG-GAP repeat protein [Streptomyces sp. HNM0575]NLU73831.1 hypothetical protein [Streptomyces sp. HNM0575]